MKRILLIILVISFFVPFGYCQELPLQLIVKTDKEMYALEEIIKITLKNSSSENIFSHIGSHTPVFSIGNIEKKDSMGGWEKLFAQCQYPHCILDIDVPVETKPKQTVVFEWNPRIYIDGTNKSIKAKSGRYRILILYQIRKDSSENWKWAIKHSNEFIIK